MYFDEPADPFDRPIGRELSIIVAATTLFTLLFFAWPTELLQAAQAAASALMP